MSDDLIFTNVKPILRSPHLRLRFKEVMANESTPIVVVGEFKCMQGPETFVIANSKGKKSRRLSIQAKN